MRQCAGKAGPAGPPRAPGARPAGTISARVISRVTPGLRTFAISEHFEFDCAKAVTCSASRTIDTTDSFMSISQKRKWLLFSRRRLRFSRTAPGKVLVEGFEPTLANNWCGLCVVGRD